MNKILKYIILSFFILALYACKKDPDFKFGDYTNVQGYYPYLVNKGALVKNVRPHSGKGFKIQLNYYSKTPVKSITLLGKAVNGARLSTTKRYTDLEVIKKFEKTQVKTMSGFSKKAQVDTMVMTWTIPKSIVNDKAYVYYRIAVENDNALSDTTAGDYWKVKSLSKEARLKYVFINGKYITGFDKSVYEYAINLPASITKVPKVTLVPYDLACSKILIKNATNLKGNLAQRTTTITVTAEDGKTSKVYKIIFSIP